MQNDIAALQYLYGANFNTNSGNNVYRWSPTTGELSIDGEDKGAPVTNKIFMTVWDGNGVDTYDLSAYTSNLTVNLQPGAFSTFSATQLADLDRVNHSTHALGNVANARLYQGDTRSLIENATGGSGNDTITGNQAANFLIGNGGNDTLEGGSNNDRLEGGAGTNTAVFSGAFGNYRITANTDGTITVEDSRQGGGDGRDVLKDVQFLDFSGQIVSAPLPTTPTTPTTPSTPMTPAPASPILRGTTGADILSGTDIDEQIFGYDGKDILSGGLGNDSLFGGAGNDLLTGGAGRDGFIFDTRVAKTNVDRIIDFKSKEDRILIDDKFFKGVGKGSLSKPVKLSKDKFYVGSSAKDANDRIVYNKSKGILSYDPDGNGHHAAIKFATVKAKMSLSAADIWII